MSRPSIHIFALGGTIAMIADEGGARPALSAADLLEAAPGIGELAAIEAHDFRRVASANLSFDDLIALARKINAQFADKADGIVVTQGTDILEESAFALDLMVEGGVVALTGAMRHPGLEGSDGPGNLTDAVRVAASDAGPGLGVFVVMAGEIHAASEVRKSHTTALDAFSSPARGPLGRVSAKEITFERQPPRPPRIAPDSVRTLANVASYSAVMDDRSQLLGKIARSDIDGLVVAAFGGGHMPERDVEVLGRIAERIPVILASRTGAGRVLEDVYAYKGAEIDLISRGLIPAGRLDAPKARVFLTLALGAGWSVAEIRAVLAGI